ncbi:MAG TPA: DUF5989 family protein [Planctomycetaceae bacterium]|nr:DUF5989 family protein [Planctomycetaceae bacterium]
MTAPPPDPKDDFAKAAQTPTPGLIAEFWDFLCTNKKWWLLPILIVFGLIGVLVLLSSSAVAPFIYPLF